MKTWVHGHFRCQPRRHQDRCVTQGVMVGERCSNKATITLPAISIVTGKGGRWCEECVTRLLHYYGSRKEE